MNESMTNEMLLLFAHVQSEVEKHAVKVANSQITFSNLISIDVSASQHGLYLYTIKVKELIEALPAYQELSRSVDEWYSSCWGAANPSVVLTLSDSLQALITEEDYEGYGELRSSTLGLWLTSSGFYRKKVLCGDATDWSGCFRQFIKDMPTQLDYFHCFLAVDPLICREIVLGDAVLVNPENEKCGVLDRLVDYELLHDYDSLSYSDPAIEKLEWRQFHYLYRLFHVPSTQSSSRAIDARYLVSSVFHLEHRALQLSTPWNLIFPNAFFLSSSGIDICTGATMLIHRTETEWSWLWHFLGDHDAMQQAIRNSTISKDREKEYAALCSRVLLLLHKHEKQMGTSLDLLDHACAVPDRAVGYLLLIISLEALLLGKGSQELKEKFCMRFAKILSPNPTTRQKLYDLAGKLYRVRSDLVHGNDANLAKDAERIEAAVGLSFHELRNMVRRIILVTLQALDSLEETSSALSITYFQPKSRRPIDSKDLMDVLHRRLFDDNLWSALYETVTAAYEADCGRHSVPFVDEI